MDQQTVIIPPAAESISLAQAIRAAGSMTVQFTAFDKHPYGRHADFHLDDSAGNPVTPGVIRADSTADFARYFQSSAVGGAFLLKAAFPVPGDGLLIAVFEMRLTNSPGTTTTGRTSF
jgi:hypothetical protein